MTVNAITPNELLAFKAHLVAEGFPMHASVVSLVSTKRDWENMLWSEWPEMFPEGMFDTVLQRAINGFIEGRERVARARQEDRGGPRVASLKSAMVTLIDLGADETFLAQFRKSIAALEQAGG